MAHLPDATGPIDPLDETPSDRGFFGFCRDHMEETEHSCMKRLLQDCISCGFCVRTAPRCRQLEHMLGLSPSTRLPDDHLQDDECIRFRSQLCAFMDGHPRHQERQASAVHQFFERLSVLSRSTFPRMIAACCVLLIVGNSVALAATDTVPGDTLYPMKVGVLEPAGAIVAMSAQGKALWASNCVRRRLLEAERLIAEDRLTPETWNALNASIEANARVAQRHILRLSKKNAPQAADLSGDLHVMLNAHGQVFADVAQTQNDPAVAQAAASLSSAASEADLLYHQTEEVVFENQADVEQAAADVLQAASSAAYTLQENIRDPAMGRGQAARRFLKSADDHFRGKEFRESMRDARMAVQQAEEGNAFARLGLRHPADAVVTEEQVLTSIPGTACGGTVVDIVLPAAALPSSSDAIDMTQFSSAQSSPPVDPDLP